MPIDNVSKIDFVKAQKPDLVLADSFPLSTNCSTHAGKAWRMISQPPFTFQCLRRPEIEARASGFLNQVAFEIVEYSVARRRIDADVVPYTLGFGTKLLMDAIYDLLGVSIPQFVEFAHEL